VLPSWWKL